MARTDDIHAAIRHIYQGSLVPGEWQPALERITRALGAHKGILNETSIGDTGLFVFTGLTRACASRLQREFDMRAPEWIRAIPVGTSLRQTSAISDADFSRSDIYNEAVRPAGGFYGIIASIVRTPVREVYFTVGRELGAADFSDADADAMNLIVPHLVNAVEVRRRLVATDRQVRSAFDVLAYVNIGVILFDAALRPVFVNRCAEVLASHGDGLQLSMRSVLATRRDESDALHRAMALSAAWFQSGRDAKERAILQKPAARLYLSREPPRLPLIVSVTPFAADDGAIEPLVAKGACGMLLVREPDGPSHLDLDVLIARFQLTRREAQLAALLARGSDLAQAAARLGIGIGTARGYLKQVLTKTSTHRQAELVAMVLQSSMQIAGAT
jgi:DNA-binding CsgD family transcriptional regulator